jgi:transcriptional regulator with XRE-family HTH domain
MGFRENLKAELTYIDMKVKELAVLSGIKKSTIDSYLRENSYTPSVSAAVAIARALGVSVEYLVTGKDIKRKSDQYPVEARLVADAISKMDKRNRKMAVAIIETMKKQEEKEKS